jgi:hypothetical protein
VGNDDEKGNTGPAKGYIDPTREKRKYTPRQPKQPRGIEPTRKSSRAGVGTSADRTPQLWEMNFRTNPTAAISAQVRVTNMGQPSELPCAEDSSIIVPVDFIAEGVVCGESYTAWVRRPPAALTPLGPLPAARWRDCSTVPLMRHGERDWPPSAQVDHTGKHYVRWGAASESRGEAVTADDGAATRSATAAAECINAERLKRRAAPAPEQAPGAKGSGGEPALPAPRVSWPLL